MDNKRWYLKMNCHNSGHLMPREGIVADLNSLTKVRP